MKLGANESPRHDTLFYLRPGTQHILKKCRKPTKDQQYSKTSDQPPQAAYYVTQAIPAIG